MPLSWGNLRSLALKTWQHVGTLWFPGSTMSLCWLWALQLQSQHSPTPPVFLLRLPYFFPPRYSPVATVFLTLFIYCVLVTVIGQLSGVNSLLPPRGSQGSNSGCQVCVPCRKPSRPLEGSVLLGFMELQGRQHRRVSPSSLSGS